MCYIPFMENLPKKRGRPRKIPEPMGPEIPDALSEIVGSPTKTARTHANAYYADRARGVIEGYVEQVKIPEDPLRAARIRVGMDWILTKKTVLTELGRMMVEEPTEQDMRRFQSTVDYVADKQKKLGAKGAVAYIRRSRLGETKKRKVRVAALHHDLNAAVNLHRQRYPESSWPDILEAVELTAGVVGRKVR